MGGQNISCDFGGGERTIECALQNKFWRAEKVGFAWSVPVSSKENNRAKTNGGGGGETYDRWGGPKPFLGEGFYGMFSPPLSFPPPFVFLLVTLCWPRYGCIPRSGANNLGEISLKLGAPNPWF